MISDAPNLIPNETSHVQRCVNSLEPIQSPNSMKNEPLPKLRIRQSREGLISELIESRKSKTIVNDVIDLCDDDEPEVENPSVVPEVTRTSRRRRQLPKRFGINAEDFRTRNTRLLISRDNIFFADKVRNNLSIIRHYLTPVDLILLETDSTSAKNYEYSNSETKRKTWDK